MDFGLKAEPLHNNVQGVFTLHNTGQWYSRQFSVWHK